LVSNGRNASRRSSLAREEEQSKATERSSSAEAIGESAGPLFIRASHVPAFDVNDSFLHSPQFAFYTTFNHFLLLNRLGNVGVGYISRLLQM
jgi:hypothetical protein